MSDHAPFIDGNALQSAASDSATRQFYQQNGWHSVWSPAARDELEQVLADRAAHGLDHLTFLTDPGPSASPSQREVAWTGAALKYAAALASGAVDPTSLHQIYTLPRPQTDLAAPLADALQHQAVASWFARLAPQDAEYGKLSQAYRSAAERSEGGSSSSSKVPETGMIHVGDTDDRVSAIANTLLGEGYLPDDGPFDGSGKRYTQRIAGAVKQLQRDYGIASDGVVGHDTLQVLNLGPGDRARALAVALERRRWLTRNPPRTRIDVNIAAARLRYYRDGKMIDSRKVIVGKPDKETPLLMSPIYRLVANPTWTVPKSIENTELANVGSLYLAKHNMVRRGGYIVQQPGPHNALGLVKFDMEDEYAIYLHDTGSPSLFKRSERHLSHGCIRVDDALGFASLIAQDEEIADEWQKARSGSDMQFVELPHKLPVRLLYRNVFVDDRGDVAFRTDPYGWNVPVTRALGFGGSSSRPTKAGPIDIGP